MVLSHIHTHPLHNFPSVNRLYSEMFDRIIGGYRTKRSLWRTTAGLAISVTKVSWCLLPVTPHFRVDGAARCGQHEWTPCLMEGWARVSSQTAVSSKRRGRERGPRRTEGGSEWVVVVVMVLGKSRSCSERERGEIKDVREENSPPQFLCQRPALPQRWPAPDPVKKKLLYISWCAQTLARAQTRMTSKQTGHFVLG